MVDRIDNPKPVHRIEVITGAGRRRRWSDDEKAKIVLESFAPGAVVAEIARRHDARAQQVHGWRRDAREGRLVLPAEQRSGELMTFAPVVVTPTMTPSRQRLPKCAAAMIEIEAKGIVVRVRDGADVAMIEAMVRALRVRA
jgi:transposase